jgi:hypothetical protein
MEQGFLVYEGVVESLPSVFLYSPALVSDI